MNIRLCDPTVAALLASVAFGANAVRAADYTMIVLERTVERPVATVWEKVGPFCAIQDWMKISCAYTSGSGGFGTVRHLAGRTDEVMVGKSATSYTYTVPTGKDLYHGTLEAVADGPQRTKLVYSIIYDQEPLGTAEAKATGRERRTKTFTAALENMKVLSEGK